MPLSGLKEGMILARVVNNSRYRPLLMPGMVLGEMHIERIGKTGYAGVYINDEASEGIDVYDVIPDDLRLSLVVLADGLITRASKGSSAKTNIQVSGKTQNGIVMPVMLALFENRNRVVEMIDLRPIDAYNYYHAANVMVLSMLLGIELGIIGTQLYELGMAALLHDIGNVFIPQAIIKKTGRLTDEEYETVKKHTELGFDHLRSNYSISIDACLGAQQHHEHYDGSGYPSGLKKDKISVSGRIIALTSVYSAMVSRRPFRDHIFPSEAMMFLESEAGAMFDPEFVREFGKVIALYPTGATVMLSNGESAIVAGNTPGNPHRPRLRVLDDGGKAKNDIDLNTDPGYKDVVVAQIVDM
jgi:HD-GYP domain-containing protein (c-di-GMP phosphodiesterase class II)